MQEMSPQMAAYNASIVASAARPYLLIHRDSGQRYAITARAMDVYRRQLGKRLERVYIVEQYTDTQE